MACGAPAGDPHRHAADRRDLRGDLLGREHATQAGLGPLTQLDLDGADRGRGHEVGDALEIERTRGIATAEVPGTDLPHEVAAVAVVLGDAAFAGPLERTGQRTAPVESLDGATAERAEAHARDVDHRGWTERAGSPVCCAHHLRRRKGEAQVRSIGFDAHRFGGEGRLPEDDVVIGVIEIVVGAEPDVGVLTFGGRVHPGPFVAAERTLLVVVGHDVLTQFGADALEDEAEVPDDRVVAQDRVLALHEVVNRDTEQDEHDGPDDDADHFEAAHRLSL